MRNLNEPRKTGDAEVRNAPVEIHPAPTDSPHTLFSRQQSEDLQSRWSTIQTSFIDEPRRAVKEADALVAAAIKQISDSFSDQRRQLEGRWSQDDKTSTEDLRMTLQQYRSFFSHLISM
jgi:hypothetical protein